MRNRKHALRLNRDACLCEIMLEVLYASQGHYALSLSRASAEWLDWLVGRVHVRVECGLATRLREWCVCMTW
jgi:hypothetical protein